MSDKINKYSLLILHFQHSPPTMDIKSVNVLIDNLKAYPTHSKKVQLANFSLSSVKAFKKFHNTLHLKLIEYVKFKKDKNLSEAAKQLKLSKEIFYDTDKWIALLSISIVFPGILLIYMFIANTSSNVMITTTVLEVLILFLLLKKIQQQPQNLVQKLEDNAKICKRLITRIDKINHI